MFAWNGLLVLEKILINACHQCIFTMLLLSTLGKGELLHLNKLVRPIYATFGTSLLSSSEEDL